MVAHLRFQKCETEFQGVVLDEIHAMRDLSSQIGFGGLGRGDDRVARGAEDGGGRSLRRAKPRNPRRFDTIEGRRVHQALLMAIQRVKAIYSRTTIVPCTFWRPGGI